MLPEVAVSQNGYVSEIEHVFMVLHSISRILRCRVVSTWIEQYYGSNSGSLESFCAEIGETNGELEQRSMFSSTF